MNKKMYETLEFNKVLEKLEEHALSDKVKLRIRKLEPFLSEAEVNRHLNETTEAKMIIEHYGNPPLSVMNDLEKSLSLLGKGTFLLPEQLVGIANFLTSCRRLKAYLKKAENTSAAVASYGNSMYELSELEDEINRTIRGSQLDDKASPLLADIRRKLINAGEQVKSKLDSLLRNNKLWFSEGFVTLRNGHYTLPVKKEYKNCIRGRVIDVSQSGNTYFIEPTAAEKLQEEISLLHIEEENEVRRILYTLTAFVEENLSYININIEAMESLDFIFAKAKLSLAMNAVPLPVTLERKIELKAARHPLLNPEAVVPLDFRIGDDIHGVVITGPNTGGKTVALKTIGLFSLMAQSGLHVPAAAGCFTMNNYVLCDIGDGQSITENLSTFSSHMTNIIQILKSADDQSLVLLDELGSGTDPAEGMGLAISILEELSAKNCLFVATTHYPEVKEFAESAPGLINARMAFDRQTLMPMYQLEIGEAGESCALYIARRLGLPPRMIERAYHAAYENKSKNTSCIKPYYPNPDKEFCPTHPVTEYGVESNPFPSSHDIGKSFLTHAQDFGPGCLPPQRIKANDSKKTAAAPRSMKFNIGDSVMVYPQKLIGIVYQKSNEKGEIGIQIKGKKLLLNHKRLRLHVPASELYPEDYDFSIIFDTVENRKARKDMARKHDPELIIESRMTDI